LIAVDRRDTGCLCESSASAGTKSAAATATAAVATAARTHECRIRCGVATTRRRGGTLSWCPLWCLRCGGRAEDHELAADLIGRQRILRFTAHAAVDDLHTIDRAWVDAAGCDAEIGAEFERRAVDGDGGRTIDGATKSGTCWKKPLSPAGREPGEPELLGDEACGAHGAARAHRAPFHRVVRE
jgi:hypothetical protein